jgi:hypothetical protein
MQLPPFKLERYFAKYEFTARYLLCSSDCEARSVADLLALEPGAAEAFQQHWLGYTESPGAPGLRQQISRIYTSIQPEQVLVFSGAEEAIFLFMQAALAPRLRGLDLAGARGGRLGPGPGRVVRPAAAQYAGSGRQPAA